MNAKQLKSIHRVQAANSNKHLGRCHLFFKGRQVKERTWAEAKGPQAPTRDRSPKPISSRSFQEPTRLSPGPSVAYFAMKMVETQPSKTLVRPGGVEKSNCIPLYGPSPLKTSKRILEHSSGQTCSSSLSNPTHLRMCKGNASPKSSR